MILNRTKTEWIVINDQNEILVGHSDSYWLPLSELNNVRTAIKSYRGWKAAINGVLQSYRCTEDDIRHNRIKVLPVTTVLQVDDSYKEIPVSSYFEDTEIKRYALTEDLNLIIDLKETESSSDKLKFRLNNERFGSKIKYFVHWNEVDKYGINHGYYDTVIKFSDNKEELEKRRDKK